MIIKHYISGMFSIIALLFYSLPWTYGATRSALGFYIIAFFWFMFAWIFLIINLIFAIKNKIQKNENWLHQCISSSLIIISYIMLFIAISKGYIVSV